MNHSLYIALALCMGQVPTSNYSPYSHPTIQPGFSQPVYSQPRPQSGGLLGNLFRNGPPSRAKAPAGPGCNCQGGAVSIPGGAVLGHPHSIQGNPSQTYIISQGQPARASLGPTLVYPYEESNAPPVYQGQPGLAITTNQPVSQEVNPEMQNLHVAKKYENQVGHADDYNWITGHLFYVHADGGRWVIRFALPGEIDKFGGSVILAPGVEMKNYREGDLVCVYGEVLSEGRTSASLGGALYRVNSITLVDRADP